MVEKQNNKREASSVQIICKKLEIETKNKDIVKEMLKKENSTFEEIEERLKLIERSIVDIQNDSLTELTKKIKILNTPLDIDRKRDITILNTSELTDWENWQTC